MDPVVDAVLDAEVSRLHTLRDEIAKAAMSVLLSESYSAVTQGKLRTIRWSEIAESAYSLADEMMKAREKEP